VEQLEDLLAATAAMEQDTAPAAHFQLLLQQGTSMGGVRPKCLVEDVSGLWLAKFPSRQDRWNNARVEMATMALAARCGIRIPELRVVQAQKGDILLVKRFDRQKTSAGYIRLGYASALSVLGLDERERERFSYLSFADRLRSGFPRSRHKEQGAELFRRLVFNILIRNMDDHPRNHGILPAGESMELAPAFDLTPTPASPGLSTEFYLAMAAGPQGRLGTMGNALAGCAHFGLTPEAAGEIIRELSEGLRAWREVFAAHGVSGEDTEIFAHTFKEK
jgi:serine/threonine-protein kinase HipA